MFRAKFSFIVLIGALCFTGTQAFAASNVASVSQIKMKYGPNGKSTPVASQCWTKIDTREYAKCLFPNGVGGGNANNIIKVELQSVQMAPAQQQYDK